MVVVDPDKGLRTHFFALLAIGNDEVQNNGQYRTQTDTGKAEAANFYQHTAHACGQYRADNDQIFWVHQNG